VRRAKQMSDDESEPVKPAKTAHKTTSQSNIIADAVEVEDNSSALHPIYRQLEDVSFVVADLAADIKALKLQLKQKQATAQ
jgi:hypothetical protein